MTKDILGTTDQRTAILDSVIEADSTLQILLGTAKKLVKWSIDMFIMLI